jgi:hypothetical protein
MEVLLVIGGVVLGVILTAIALSGFYIGELLIVKVPDSDEPYLCSELSKPVDSFRSKKYVLLKVKHKNSQK